METHNLPVQFVFYKNHGSQNVRIISNPMYAFLVLTFHILEHILNSLSFSDSKLVSMYVLHISIRYFKKHTVPTTMIKQKTKQFTIFWSLLN
jgi:hypothetical protein